VRRVAAVAATMLIGAPAAAAAPTPAKLYSALLRATVTTAQLPHGFTGPAVGVYKLEAATKKHHAVGGVEIVADEGSDAVIYIVFASAADARADWAHADFSGITTAAAPKSIAKPSIVANASSSAQVSGKTVTIGLTNVSALRGNVIVEAVTTSTTNKTHGDVAGAVALARFALAHLAAVGGA
jgi:hypothetical protein